MVDMVNFIGVEINEVMKDLYIVNLFFYIVGFGFCKVQFLIKGINVNGGVVNVCDELVGDFFCYKILVLGLRVWNNVVSFFYIEYDFIYFDLDLLDNICIYFEDYDLVCKVVVDVLGFDEEDVKVEMDFNGLVVIVCKFFNDDV